MKTTVCLKSFVNYCKIKRQIKYQIIGIEFHDIIDFGIINKITVNPKDNGFTTTGLQHRYSLDNFRDFGRLSWMRASKVITTDKCMFKVSMKVTNTASIYVILMFLV